MYARSKTPNKMSRQRRDDLPAMHIAVGFRDSLDRQEQNRRHQIRWNLKRREGA